MWDDDEFARDMGKLFEESARRSEQDRRQAEEERWRAEANRPRNNNTQNSSASNDGWGTLILLGIGGFIIYEIYMFIQANWVSIVTILGICVACVITCIIIWFKAKKPGLKTFFTILTSIGLIIGVLYFGPEKIKEIFNKDIFNKLSQTTVFQKESTSSNQTTQYAVVIPDALNIRAGPSVDNEIIGRLTKDDRIEILGNSGPWWKVKSGDIEGYADSDYLREIQP